MKIVIGTEWNQSDWLQFSCCCLLAPEFNLHGPQFLIGTNGASFIVLGRLNDSLCKAIRIMLHVLDIIIIDNL